MYLYRTSTTLFIIISLLLSLIHVRLTAPLSSDCLNITKAFNWHEVSLINVCRLAHIRVYDPPRWSTVVCVCVDSNIIVFMQKKARLTTTRTWTMKFYIILRRMDWPSVFTVLTWMIDWFSLEVIYFNIYGSLSLHLQSTC